jgi:hypothetical protein
MSGADFRWTPGGTQYYGRDLHYEVVPFAPVELQGGGWRELTQADLGQIMRYGRRVAARTARRMEALDQPFEARRRQSTTFERHEEANPPR